MAQSRWARGLVGLVAVVVILSMVWTTVGIAVLSVRGTRWLWRTLIRISRRSQFAAGLVTAFSLAIGVASILLFRSDSLASAATAVDQSISRPIRHAPARCSAT